eukprot:TRINITY_DN2579_c0_g2_i1.p1 TRINITY_DN2579_c0_g2~~TRINITY_DN2579_c0_g2_i1.p1  ORF type:complete len:526 (+),score=15.35 TRINITY_DN2579_c0_g2_i1:80-1579(+)
MSIKNNKTGAHILVFPFPAQGHIIPLLDLTHQLVTRGLTITILVTPKNLPMLDPLLTKHPTIQTLVLPFPKHPSIPDGVENVKDLPNHSLHSIGLMMRTLGSLYQPLLHWFKTHTSPPRAILSDFFLGWTHHLACQLSIPRVVFSPSPALLWAVNNCLWRHVPDEIEPHDPNFQITFQEVPKSPTYPWYHLSSFYRCYKKGDPVLEFVKDGFIANLASWGIVFNSFDVLEAAYLEHMKKDLGHNRVWAVGPLCPPSEPTNRGVVVTWLDTCPERSVIYVCFGSEAVLTRRQMAELADGLEHSGVRFVWCVKEATTGHVAGEYGVVPTGFDERVAGRGLVIRGWVPQASILSHASVSGFLTHCGWNSVIEGLVAGVSLLAWPMRADQFMNANLVVEDLGVGVRVCEGADSVPDSAELALIFSDSVGGSGSKRRNRVEELSRAARVSVKEGGSSYRELNELVRALGSLSSVGPTERVFVEPYSSLKTEYAPLYCNGESVAG